MALGQLAQIQRVFLYRDVVQAIRFFVGAIPCAKRSKEIQTGAKPRLGDGEQTFVAPAPGQLVALEKDIVRLSQAVIPGKVNVPISCRYRDALIELQTVQRLLRPVELPEA